MQYNRTRISISSSSFLVRDLLNLSYTVSMLVRSYILNFIKISHETSYIYHWNCVFFYFPLLFETFQTQRNVCILILINVYCSFFLQRIKKFFFLSFFLSSRKKWTSKSRYFSNCKDAIKQIFLLISITKISWIIANCWI